jgi:excisionase family DNA binding protein
MTQPASRSSLLRVEAVATRLAVSTRHVRRLIAAGDLPVHRIGRSVRVAEEDLERLLRQSRQ